MNINDALLFLSSNEHPKSIRIRCFTRLSGHFVPTFAFVFAVSLAYLAILCRHSVLQIDCRIEPQSESAGPAPQGGQRGQPPPQLPAGPHFYRICRNAYFEIKSTCNIISPLCLRSQRQDSGYGHMYFTGMPHHSLTLGEGKRLIHSHIRLDKHTNITHNSLTHH